MSLATEDQRKHLEETCGCADHDHDLMHELSTRPDVSWHDDQRTANAERRADVQDFGRGLERQDEKNVRRLKQPFGEAIQKGCF